MAAQAESRRATGPAKASAVTSGVRRVIGSDLVDRRPYHAVMARFEPCHRSRGSCIPDNVRDGLPVTGRSPILSPMPAQSSPIGRVVATELKPSTPHQFWFWTARDATVGI